jgi:hypothetical protein
MKGVFVIKYMPVCYFIAGSLKDCRLMLRCNWLMQLLGTLRLMACNEIVDSMSCGGASYHHHSIALKDLAMVLQQEANLPTSCHCHRDEQQEKGKVGFSHNPCATATFSTARLQQQLTMQSFGSHPGCASSRLHQGSVLLQGCFPSGIPAPYQRRLLPNSGINNVAISRLPDRNSTSPSVQRPMVRAAAIFKGPQRQRGRGGGFQRS